jgi:TM2 domain-containing membrane protein YozV
MQDSLISIIIVLSLPCFVIFCIYMAIKGFKQRRFWGSPTHLNGLDRVFNGLCSIEKNLK